MIRIFTALICLWTLAACASTDAADGQSASTRDCFNSDQVSGYGVIDNHNVSVTIGASRRYVLTTTWNARDLDWTRAIAIRSHLIEKGIAKDRIVVEPLAASAGAGARDRVDIVSKAL